MGIKVQYRDNSFGDVAADALDGLIASGSIVAFRRREGWVEVDIDPLRGKGAREEYAGEERRGGENRKNCLVCSDFVDSMCRASICPHRTSLQGKEST